MKYALFGYSYQEHVTFLFLSLMDTERNISLIREEANVEHDFDDIIVSEGDRDYHLQLKDMERIKLEDLSVSQSHITIKGKPHKLSPGINVILFCSISIKPNCEILGFKAFELSGVYIVSVSREQIEKRIDKLYGSNQHRRQLLQHFFGQRRDKRNLEIKRGQLPTITTFDTRLSEQTIKVARHIMEFENILHIEGKPGVGKSHLVGLLEEQYQGTLLYRFWISNQDKLYEERLIFQNFLNDLSKTIFADLRNRNEDELLQALSSNGKFLIIDGLDHVENYRSQDLDLYVAFIDKAAKICKVIILSRPLKRALNWKKQTLTNWTSSQTEQVLKELYHIEKYQHWQEIYRITDGYPILVRYVSEQLKKEGTIPAFATLPTVSAYYDQLFSKESGKKALALFLCCRGYIMRSEITLLLGEIPGEIVEQMIDERPYLFEIRLNRISLYHDSLITYLRDNFALTPVVLQQVNQLVFNSIMSGETRFQSRVGLFGLPAENIAAILRHYSSLDTFKKLISHVVDFEAVAEFYHHLHEMLLQASHEDLEVREYYELSMILNITGRDHLSTMTGFYYTFTLLLLQHGYTENDITSSGYLYGMLLYLKNQDATFIFKLKSDQNYDTNRFYHELEHDTEEEQYFFERHSRPFRKTEIIRALKDTNHFNYHAHVQLCLANIYIHKKHHKQFPLLYLSVSQFLSGDEIRAARTLGAALPEMGRLDYRPAWILGLTKELLLSLGIHPETNDYLTLSLQDYLHKHRKKGSFTLRKELLSYLRLAYRDKREIEISSASKFITKYYNRHDYSLNSIDEALTVFERKGYIKWQDSILLITKIQEQSEKGYRGLLADYLTLHEPDFINQVLDTFNTDDLRISWLELPPKYIDILPYHLYTKELVKLFRYNDSNREIPLREIHNLLHSEKLNLIKRDIRMAAFFVGVHPSDPEIKFLQANNIPYKIQSQERQYSESTAEELFERGTINYSNIDDAIKGGFTPEKIAGYADSNAWALANPEFFQRFPREEIARKLQHILYNALTGRTRSITYFHSTFMIPGTILRIIDDCNASMDFWELFESYKSYLELSMFEINNAQPDIAPKHEYYSDHQQ